MAPNPIQERRRERAAPKYPRRAASVPLDSERSNRELGYLESARTNKERAMATRERARAAVAEALEERKKAAAKERALPRHRTAQPPLLQSGVHLTSLHSRLKVP